MLTVNKNHRIEQGSRFKISQSGGTLACVCVPTEMVTVLPLLQCETSYRS